MNEPQNRQGHSVFYNCGQWHNEVVICVLKQNRPGWVFRSGYQPKVALDRCPSGALAMGDHPVPVVNLDRCFECAVCASGYPERAVSMEAKSKNFQRNQGGGWSGSSFSKTSGSRILRKHNE